MRLIDADAYSAEMKERQKACVKWLEAAQGNEDEYALARQAFETFCEAKLTLDKMPTIEAEPVRHGHWKQRKDKNWSGGGVVFCSACRYGFSFGGYHAVEETFLYCPACGARMENGGNG